MNPRILVTGFEPFGGRSDNPTEHLVTALADAHVPGVEVRTAVLPVEYDVALDVALAHLSEVRPDAVIACGLAAGRADVTPERIAINVKGSSPDPTHRDNAGRHLLDDPISDGPDGLFATLPVRAIQQALVAEGVPASVSNSAGSFVCNNVMYGVLDHLRRTESRTLAGFVHFPASTEMAADEPDLPSLPMDVMHRALLVVVETVAEYLPHPSDPLASSGL